MNEDVEQSRLRVSRRRALGVGGTVGLGALLAACGVGGSGSSGNGATGSATASATPSATATGIQPTTTADADVVALLDELEGSCTLSSEETQGPYWFDVDSIRSDIREDRPGTTLALALRVMDVSQCSTTGDAGTPIPNSVVEIWHCDAGGVYSGFESSSQGGQGGGPPAGGGGSGGGDQGSGQASDGSYSQGDDEASPTDDGTYLRGAQVADSNGIVQFTTIWPGWYRGRTVHIHLKVHIDRSTVLTTQLWFDDELNDTVFATSPYDEHTGRDTMNDDDSIIDDSGSVTVHAADDGYLGVLNLGVGGTTHS